MLMSILGFICILGPLVVVHEFGHFFFAKVFGVKAEVFSVGFGPKIWSRQRGETEWCLSAIPLGGYVKLLGEEPGVELPAELAHRSLQRQDRWKRFFIFFGGPLFNFIFAALIFMAIQMIGEEHIVSRVGRVLPGSPAATFGLVSGDRVISVAGKPVSKFEEVEAILGENPGRPVDLLVERESATQPVAVQVVPTATSGYSAFGEKTDVGSLEGIFPAARDAVIGVSNPGSAAGLAGAASGDRIVSWNGVSVVNFEQLERLDSETPKGAAVTVGLRSGERDFEVRFVKSGASGLGSGSGLHSSELFIEKVVADSPASKLGLRRGDRIVSIDGVEIASFFELRNRVQKAGESKGRLVLGWEREGKLLQQELVPSASTTRDPELATSKQFTIGVYPMLAWAQPDVVVERTFNPLVVVPEGVSRMVSLSWRNIVSLGKMLVGDVSVRTLGGPILIGKIAGESLSRGLITFLSTMAILSIGLGVLNVLPIPVLDGGHILLLGVEAVRGKPLQMRQLEIVQQVGLALILLLMIVVMKNDVTRLF